MDYDVIQNKLKLLIHADHKSITHNKDEIELFFNNLSLNTTIEELYITQTNRPDDTHKRQQMIYDYIKFPKNLKILSLPQTYSDWRSMNSRVVIFNGGPRIEIQIPQNLEKLILPDIGCFMTLLLYNTNLKHIVICEAYFVDPKKHNISTVLIDSFCNHFSSNYNMPTLESITFYLCNNIQLLDNMMKRLKLSYGCIYTINSDKYVEKQINDNTTNNQSITMFTKSRKISYTL